MAPSVAAILAAAGGAVVSGVLALAALAWLSKHSTLWAVRLSTLVPVVGVAVGVIVASAMMVLKPDQMRVMLLVLAVATLISLGFGAIAGRRVADLQRQAVEHAAARQRDRAIEERRRELIAWLSHDLRTPLARLRILTEAQQDGLAPPDYAARMSREIDGLTVIIDDIALLSRLHSPGVALDVQRMDLGDVVSDALAGNQPLARDLGLTLVGDRGGAVPFAADPVEIARAVDNLVVNALRHTRPGGEVHVGVAGEPGAVRVTVRDQCGGIPEDHLQRLFEPGWRGTSARTPGDSGAGLGLTISQRIAQAHGGTIEVANVGDGCQFTLVLPAEPAGADPGRQDERGSWSGSPITG